MGVCFGGLANHTILIWFTIVTCKRGKSQEAHQHSPGTCQTVLAREGCAVQPESFGRLKAKAANLFSLCSSQASLQTFFPSVALQISPGGAVGISEGLMCPSLAEALSTLSSGLHHRLLLRCISDLFTADLCTQQDHVDEVTDRRDASQAMDQNTQKKPMKYHGENLPVPPQ